jgi:glucose/arabinose dehydrogenase
LWITEHGPRGGDELNRVLAGRNYGWPLASYGCPYSFARSEPSCRPGGGTHARIEEPDTWLPIRPALGPGLYSGDNFEWRATPASAGRCHLGRHVLDANDMSCQRGRGHALGA